MSDKLQVLKSQAKLSMQSLVDRALVQDEVSKYKRLLFKRSYRSIIMAISVPMAFVFFYKLHEMGRFHKNFQVGAANFFVIHGLGARELYAPEIYAKDQKLRPYESGQFS